MYFHGRLAVSPGNTRIAESGWVWGPVGVLASWDLKAWVTDNLWESEDGATLEQIGRAHV